jgi:hypothetical protein
VSAPGPYVSPTVRRFSATEGLWPRVPRMRISMLGATGSGKSSYLAVMYDNIAPGKYQYTFKTDDEVRLRVNGELDALRSGKPLDPTDEMSPKQHHYTLGSLRHGKFTVLVEIYLTDFRGGAILYPGATNTDSAKLYGQLSESDSILVVLDSTHFVEPVTPTRYEQVVSITDANHIATLIGGILVDRKERGRELPSIAVLLAKSDVLYEWHRRERRPRRDPGEVRQNVLDLLPTAFGMGEKSGLFQVSVGEFVVDNGTNRLIGIEPDGVAAPLFFAVACFLADHQKVLRSEQQRIQDEWEKARAQRVRWESWPPLAQRLFLQRKLADIKAVLDRMEGQLRAYNERSDDLTQERELLWEWLRPALWSRPS